MGSRRPPALLRIAIVAAAAAVCPALVGCVPSEREPEVPTRALGTSFFDDDANARRVVRDSPPTEAAREAVAFSLAQVHKRYCYGGTGPSCFDCSGLAQTAWTRAGTKVPRTSDAIAATLPEVPLSAIRAGDILWWPGHVGIYIGEGRMVDALNSRRGVVERAVSDPQRAFRPPS